MEQQTGPGMPVPRLHPQALLCGGTERTKHLSPVPFTMGAESSAKTRGFHTQLDEGPETP